MRLFPFFMDIETFDFLVVGGGRIARDKVEKLRLFTDRITVVARNTDIDNVRVIRRDFDDGDLEGADAVICATDDPLLNRRIAALCRQKKIPVNAVDSPQDCTFVFPAIVKKGSLTAAVSTDGKSPLVSRYVKQKIEDVLPGNIETVLDRLGELREQVKSEVPEQKEREKIFAAALAQFLEAGEQK